MTELMLIEKCSHCGGEAEICVYTGTDDAVYFVRCSKCHCRTPFFEDPFSAITLWNNRMPEACNDDDDDDDEVYDVKKIYVSLPIDGIDEDELYSILKILCETTSEYINSEVELCEPLYEEGSNDIEILAARLKSMAEADYVVFPENWGTIRESCVEHMTAEIYKKKILIAEKSDITQEED